MPTGDVAREQRLSRGERLRALLPDLWELVRPRLGLLGLGLLLLVVNRVAGLALPAATRILIDDIIGAGRRELLGPLVGALLGATLLQAVTGFALAQSLSRAAQRLIADLRRRVQAHLGRLGVTYFDTHRSGELATRVMNDAEGLRNLIGTGLVEFVGGVLTASLAAALMLHLSPRLTWLTLGLVLAFGALLGFSFGRLRPIFRERGQIYAEVSGRLQESLAGIRVVKGYRAEAREEQVFGAGVARLLANVMRTLTAMSLMSLAVTTLLGLMAAGMTYAGARLVLEGALTLGGLFTFTVLLGFLVAPVLQVVGIGTQLTEALAGLERIRELLREKREDQDPRRQVVLPRLRGEVHFEQVSFAYEPGKPVLQAVSLHAPAGSVTALVGPSGAGKSTLIGLVAGFHTPQSGCVRVDGLDLSTLTLDSYRSQLGVVLQETFLFDGTIRENVTFARPEASEQAWRAACRVARVDEFAEGFAQGYETVVGERGVKLSGGQRQRVAIARAVLADPRLLILDEATSSLDSESERFIQEGLAHLMRGRTTFVIAHRLSTIRRADQILVLEAGRIVERGRHAELLALGGRYHAMYTLQHDLEANLFLAPGEGGEERAPETVPEGAQAGTLLARASGAIVPRP